MPIRIVTDSTCDLPPDLLAQHHITVVPVHINIGAASYLDGVDISRAEFYQELLKRRPLPTTSAPGPGAFGAIYQQLAAEGATEILSIHISTTLSAVANAARLAAQEIVEVPVTVHDSGQISLGTGFLVLAAAHAAEQGQTMDQILDMLRERATRTFVFAALETLEFLRRSGRMNFAMAGLGSLLQIKPVLKMSLGIAESIKVRTERRAVERVLSLAAEAAPFEQLALVHTYAQEKARAFGKQVVQRFGLQAIPMLVNVTPVLGAHLGPGVVGLACVSAPAGQTGLSGQKAAP